MNDICCLHRARNIFSENAPLGVSPEFEQRELVHEPWTMGLPLWSTCQREIIVTDLVTAEKHRLFSNTVGSSADKIYTGTDAYQFLLEVISGLHSKLIGETEILGQFKTFLTKLQTEHAAFYKMHGSFFQNLLTDTKKVRDLHLKNLGAQSYGSLVRRSLKDEDEVVVFGGGQLAAEILPWLDKKTKVHVVVRDKEKAKNYLKEKVKNQKHFEVLSLVEWQMMKPLENQAWIVAAPIPNRDVSKWLETASGVKRLIDLRGENELAWDESPHEDISYLSFKDVLSQIESFNSHVKEKTAAAFNEIQARTEKYRALTVYRPQGWDDLWN